jgi:hypothetical protein
MKITNGFMLKEALIKYREAVLDLQPRVAGAATLGDEFQSASTPAPFHASIPNVTAERQRWAGGRYRFAVLKWHRSTLFIQPIQLDQRFLDCPSKLFKATSRVKLNQPYRGCRKIC